MRQRKLLLIIVFIGVVFLSGYFFFLRLPKASPLKPGTTRLSIAAMPSITQAYIDEVGPYPLPYTQSIPFGDHEIEFIAEGYTAKIIHITPKTSQPITISETLEITTRPTLSFLPLVTEPTASSIGGSKTTVYYTIGNEIREVKSKLLRARLPGSIKFSSWASTGVGIIQTAQGSYLFTPPLGIKKLPFSPTRAFIAPRGDFVLYQEGNVVKRYQFTTGETEVVFQTPSNNDILFSTMDNDETTVIFLAKTLGGAALAKFSFSSKLYTVLKSNLPLNSSIAINTNGTFVAFTTNTSVELYRLPLFTLIASYPKETTGETLAIWDNDSFKLFEKTTLPITNVPITQVSEIFPQSNKKEFIAFDAPIKNRIDLSVPPISLPGGGIVLSEKSGPLWYLGDTSNLPKSLFDESLPQSLQEAP